MDPFVAYLCVVRPATRQICSLWDLRIWRTGYQGGVAKDGLANGDIGLNPIFTCF